MQPAPTLKDLASSFFEGHLSHWPEEAALMGRPLTGLLDASPAGAAARADFYRSQAYALQAFADEAGPLDERARLDLEAMQRLCLDRTHRLEPEGAGPLNVERYMLPQGVLLHALARLRCVEDWDTVATLLEALPDGLAGHALSVHHAIRRQRSIDRGHLELALSTLLPGQIRAFSEAVPEALDRAAAQGLGPTPALDGALRRQAARAAEMHAPLIQALTEARSKACDAWALGETLYTWRATHLLRLDDPGELVARAHADLANAHEAIKDLMAKLDPQAGHADLLAAALACFARLDAEVLTEAEAIKPLYAHTLDRAIQTVRRNGWFTLPEPLPLALVHPSEMLGGYPPLTNWPAPLLDPAGQAAVALSRDPANHHPLRAAQLAAHEGVPGHGLQSLAWQQQFADHPAPVRCLSMFDEIAAARQDFSAMVHIEGFATDVERLMLSDPAHYEPGEALFAWICRALRAGRLIIDVGLHTGQMTPDEAAEWLHTSSGFDRSTCKGEVIRAQRVPLQMATYLAGALAIEDLRANAQRREGAHFSVADFHTRLLAAGPVPPASLGDL